MSEVRLPALDGRQPLAFLAALGVLRLLDVHRGHDVRLSFSLTDAVAVLHGVDDLDAVVAELVAAVDSVPDAGALPGVPANFPPPGAAPDRMRMSRSELRELVSSLQENDAEQLAWVQALVTDLVLDDRQRVALNPFCAPTGKQSTRTMLEKPLQLVRADPSVLREALVGWRRYPGVTGEGLDHRVLFDAADAGNGESRMRGVPGATWLALMSLPYFPVTATSREPTSHGWQRPDGRRSRRQFVYPLWEQPLDGRTIPVLLGHPLWRNARERDKAPAGAAALGVFHVCRATRLQPAGSKSAGYLQRIG